ncbi:hypothetical protein, partial [Pseudomonas syringae]|uniref:hypothetical protein n=1 Tax=Pseudomonas syringae TaxID=317 RepID=UPI001C556E46
RNAKQGRQVEKNRLGNEDGANGLIVQRLLSREYVDSKRGREVKACATATQPAANDRPLRQAQPAIGN